MGKSKWARDPDERVKPLPDYRPSRRLIYLYAPLLIVLLSLLTGCVTLKDPEGSQEFRSIVTGTVDAEHTVGQSFVSRRERLNGIDLWLKIDPESPDQSGTLIVELFHTPEEVYPLEVALLSFKEIAQNSPVHVKFPSQAGHPGQSYFLSLNTTKGSVQVLGHDEDAYPKGNVFHNGMPVEADAAFRLSYDYGLAGLLSDLQRLIINAGLIIPLGLTLIIPGWLLLNLSGIQTGYDTGERIAISVGLSLAIIPIVMTWTSLLGLAWGKVSVLFAGGLLSALAIWRLWSIRPWKTPKISGHGIALAGIFILTLVVRLIMVRDLFAPAWVDSVHHGAITRLILETGGFPDTYSPLLDIDSANYHAGFHSVLATFQWLSSLELQTGMLLFGQVLNALAVFAMYLFTVKLVGSRTAGVIAALITGLITPMPAYYSSWGRYTQLVGILILPVAFVLIKRVIDPLRHPDFGDEALDSTTQKTSLLTKRWKFVLLVGIAIGGLFLAHYRVAVFLGCLVMADFISQIWPQLKKGATWKDLLREIVLILVAGGCAILLVAPWMLPTFTTLLIPKFQAWRGFNAPLFEGFVWVFLNSALGEYALVLAGLGLLWGIIKRQWFILTLVLWVVMLFALANLASLGLPGGAFINNLSVEIALFLPISVLGGYLLSEIIATGGVFIPTQWQKQYYWGLGITGIVIALVGARHLLPLLNPITFLFREADQPALSWLEENLPEGETVLINPFAWGYGLYAGNDGGYWTSPLAGLKTIPPPVLYGLGNTVEDIQRINEISQEVIANGNNADAIYTLLVEEDIQYVFVGARGGPLSPRALRESPLFELIYNKDGTWVFRISPNP